MQEMTRANVREVYFKPILKDSQHNPQYKPVMSGKPLPAALALLNYCDKNGTCKGENAIDLAASIFEQAVTSMNSRQDVFGSLEITDTHKPYEKMLGFVSERSVDIVEECSRSVRRSPLPEQLPEPLLFDSFEDGDLYASVR